MEVFFAMHQAGNPKIGKRLNACHLADRNIDRIVEVRIKRSRSVYIQGMIQANVLSDPKQDMKYAVTQYEGRKPFCHPIFDEFKCTKAKK